MQNKKGQKLKKWIIVAVVIFLFLFGIGIGFYAMQKADPGSMAGIAYHAVVNVIRNTVESVKGILHIESEKAPLSGINDSADDHKHCVLHILLALATVIVLIWYVADKRKQQRKIEELKDKMDLELTKRGSDVKKERKKNG